MAKNIAVDFQSRFDTGVKSYNLIERHDDALWLTKGFRE